MIFYTIVCLCFMIFIRKFIIKIPILSVSYELYAEFYFLKWKIEKYLFYLTYLLLSHILSSDTLSKPLLDFKLKIYLHILNSCQSIQPRYLCFNSLLISWTLTEWSVSCFRVIIFLNLMQRGCDHYQSVKYKYFKLNVNNFNSCILQQEGNSLS